MEVAVRIATLVVAVVLSVAGRVAAAQEIRVYPAGPTPMYPVNPARGYTDFVVHDIIVVNTSGGPLTVRSVHVDALRHSDDMATVAIDRDDMLGPTKELVEMRTQGMSNIADLMLPPAALGAGNRPVAQLKLPPHGALVMGPVYVAVHGNPTSIRIRATLADAHGVTKEITTILPVIGPDQPYTYAFPLRGAWFQRSVPNVTSHHRWNAQTEYAMDYFRLDSTGSPSHGAGDTATDYYGFGQSVYAADSGTVVAVANDAVQDYATHRHRPGESDDDYVRRVSRANMMAMVTDPYRGTIGNYVTIAHANGQYSMYGHLKTGSVIVTKGSRVARGQQIGQVGDTGDSPLAHLHFQIADGPDPLHARSIPFHFGDIPAADPDLGVFVEATAHAPPS
jgi:murein DD-endopeptidase MepM/ murein hydrolase activator NlpD